jgi:hypothetical protein
VSLISFARRSWVGIAVCLQIAAIGLLDFLTGYKLAFFVFYFLPIGYVAWREGRLAGCVVSGVSASVWLALDVIGRHQTALPPEEWWNSGIRLISFLVFALTFARIKELLNRERELSGRLQASLDQVQELRGLLPICAACKRIRDDEGYWQQIEAYISTHSRAEFTHGICPECARQLYPEYYEERQEGKEDKKKNPSKQAKAPPR